MMRLSPVCRLPGDQLARCLAGIVSAAGPCGEFRRVRIDVLGGVVSFAATDGRRLYVSQAEVEQSVDDHAFAIPLAAACAAQALATAACGADVQLIRTQTQATWSIDGVCLSSPVLGGGVASWRQSVPRRARGRRPTVCASALLAAIVAAEARLDRRRAVSFRFGPQNVSLVCGSSRYGESAIVCPAAGVELNAERALNPRHVREWLAALDGSATVSIDPGDGVAPVVLEHDDAMALVYPVRSCRTFSAEAR